MAEASGLSQMGIVPVLIFVEISRQKSRLERWGSNLES